jgi:trehalose 6-phosphate synthase
MVEARMDRDHFAVELRGHTSLVRPFPISVQSWAEKGIPFGSALDRQIDQFQEVLGIADQIIAVGVDRVDYTKGLAERFQAIDRFLERFPQYRERFVFVQLGAPSRMHIPRYRDHQAELERLAQKINGKHQAGSWKPIHFLIGNHDSSMVHAFLRMADVCIVSSLHDGMNLVAKEYVAAREDGDGVLILSEFAGAARELHDAMIINPYDIEQFASAIRYAVEMAPDERQTRMERMRRTVAENNIYRWAANFLSELAATRPHDVSSTSRRRPRFAEAWKHA